MENGLDPPAYDVRWQNGNRGSPPDVTLSEAGDASPKKETRGSNKKPDSLEMVPLSQADQIEPDPFPPVRQYAIRDPSNDQYPSQQPSIPGQFPPHQPPSSLVQYPPYRPSPSGHCSPQQPEFIAGQYPLNQPPFASKDYATESSSKAQYSSIHDPCAAPPDRTYPPPGGVDYPFPGSSAYPPSTGNQHESIPLVPTEQKPTVILIDPGDIPDLPRLISPDQNQLKVEKDEEWDINCGACCGLFFSVGSIVTFFVCLWLLIRQINAKHCPTKSCTLPDDFDGVVFDLATLMCAIIFLGVSWIMYMIEGCLSGTLAYVSNTKSQEELLEYVDNVRNMCPRIEWKIECYHFDTESKTISRYRDGEVMEGKVEETETHKLITHTEKKIFRYATMTDASGSIGKFDRNRITRVEMESTYGFMNKSTMERCEKEKQRFKNFYKNRDLHFDFEEKYVMEDITPRMSVYVDEDSKYPCTGQKHFWLSLLCFLSWPYRLWYKTVTNRRKYTFIKLIGD